MAAPSGTPYRLSTLYHKQLPMAKSFALDEYGWKRAEAFTDREDEKQRAEGSVGLADIPHVGKLFLRGHGVEKVLNDEYPSGTPLKPGMVLKSASPVLRDSLCCIIASDETLVLSHPRAQQGLHAHLNARSESCFHVTDVSSGLAGLCLIGPKSRDVISKLTELNVNPEAFEDLGFSPAPLYHVQSFVLRRDLNGLLSYQLYFDREFGEYLWDRIVQAGREYSVAHIGRSALKLLGWEWD